MKSVYNLRRNMDEYFRDEGAYSFHGGSFRWPSELVGRKPRTVEARKGRRLELHGIKTYLDTSPALRLLKSPNAAFIIHFLFLTFKKPGRITVGMADLQAALDDYRETLHETYPEALSDKSDSYLSTWCSGDNRWLHRFLEIGRNEPSFQLTPHTEDVLLFLDRALQRDLGFVGTESRLKLVISTLSELASEASGDPKVRLDHLYEQRRRIDAEIAHVDQHGIAARPEPAAVRERFSMAVNLLKQLLADFRAVEDRFKEITQQVQHRQITGEETRGSILAFALDSEDILKKEDQGVSFYEFVRFILSPTQQERLGKLIDELGQIQDLATQLDGLTTIRRMVPSLLAEAEKVMRTNQRLSATLRRLLDSRAATERRRLTQLLAEIRGLAAKLTIVGETEALKVEVETGVRINSAMNRTFWSQPPRFPKIELTNQIIDDVERIRMFQILAKMHRLDMRAMRDHIRQLTADGNSVTLRQLVDAYPPTTGVIELLGYLQIARDDQHLISRTESEQIILPPSEPSGVTRYIAVPLVFFLHVKKESHAQSTADI